MATTEYRIPGAEEPTPEPINPLGPPPPFSVLSFFLRLVQLNLIAIAAMLICSTPGISSELGLSNFFNALIVQAIWSSIFTVENLIGLFFGLRYRNSGFLYFLAFADIAMCCLTVSAAGPFLGKAMGLIMNDIAQCNASRCKVVAVAGILPLLCVFASFISALDNINTIIITTYTTKFRFE